MTTYRIYETGNDTGKKWFYAKEKFLCFWVCPRADNLSQLNIAGGSSPIYFNTKEELIFAIKDAHKKPVNTSFCHKVVDELEIAD